MFLGIRLPVFGRYIVQYNDLFGREVTLYAEGGGNHPDNGLRQATFHHYSI
ncbi:hypothetical protein V3F56_05355 [Moorellaceae bacterium AZ2]